MAVLPPFVLAIIGTSLTSGFLSADWVPRLARELLNQPQAKGPVVVYNLGKGSQTSTSWGVPQAPLISALKPTHVLFEGFGINDSVDFGAGPSVTRAQHILNIQAMVAEWQANIPGVDLTIQTMSPVAVYNTIRPALADYYADEVATGTTLGIRVLDNYAGWPKPLPGNISNGATTFAIAPTATFGPQVGGAAWNSADKAANVALSASTLFAYSTAAGNGSVRGNTSLVGKIHFEVTLGPVSGNRPGVGIANGAHVLTNFVGFDNNGIALYPDGDVYRNNVSQGASGLGALAAGDVIGVEVDVAGALIYFMKGATRSAGFPIGALGAVPLFPALSVNAEMTGATAKFATDGDGLHPIYAGGVDTYLYPAVLAWARARMAEHWP